MCKSLGRQVWEKDPFNAGQFVARVGPFVLRVREGAGDSDAPAGRVLPHRGPATPSAVSTWEVSRATGRLLARGFEESLEAAKRAAEQAAPRTQIAALTS